MTGLPMEKKNIGSYIDDTSSIGTAAAHYIDDTSSIGTQ